MIKPAFEFDPETRRELGHKVINIIADYYSSLRTRAVQPPFEARKIQSARDCYTPLPETGAEAASIIDDFCQRFFRDGFHTASANYFGLMNPAPTYAAALAELLVAAFNPQ